MLQVFCLGAVCASALCGQPSAFPSDVTVGSLPEQVKLHQASLDRSAYEASRHSLGYTGFSALFQKRSLAVSQSERTLQDASLKPIEKVLRKQLSGSGGTDKRRQFL